MDDLNNSKQLREMIRMLERKFGTLLESEFSCCNISLAQCHALVEIGRVGSISLNELADLLNLENSTMSRTVNNLVTSNLAKRDIDPRDRRYVAISLTEDGLKLFKEIEESMNEYFLKLYDTIPEDKKLQVLDSLQILLQAINQNKDSK